METTLWIIKGLLAALFLLTGIFKLISSKNQLLEKGMKGLANISIGQIRIIGLLEVLGACGLVLPALLNIYPVLSGIAALGLALTMVVAIRVHQMLKEPIVANLVILALCLFIVYAQFFG